jgi:hypothetical protein
VNAPRTREECFARLDKNFLPFFQRMMDTEDSQTLHQDEQVWRWFVDYITGPFMHRLLYEEAQGPKCLACEGEGSAGEWDEFHEFSPRDKTGEPPCLCSHPLGSHTKGEKGENNPMYRYFETLTRAKNPVPGMGPVPPIYDFNLLRLFWEVMYQFEAYRTITTDFFGVTKDGPRG